MLTPGEILLLEQQLATAKSGNKDFYDDLSPPPPNREWDSQDSHAEPVKLSSLLNCYSTVMARHLQINQYWPGPVISTNGLVITSPFMADSLVRDDEDRWDVDTHECPMCTSSLEHSSGYNCSCFSSPPCTSCTDFGVQCPGCSWKPEERPSYYYDE